MPQKPNHSASTTPSGSVSPEIRARPKSSVLKNCSRNNSQKNAATNTPPGPRSLASSSTSTKLLPVNSQLSNISAQHQVLLPLPLAGEGRGEGGAALNHITRRHFFSRCGLGLGSIALASLLSDQRLFAADAPKLVNPLAPKPPHFAARAKNVIFLFMAGGPSQLELFDYKPKLIELNGQVIPQSFIEGKRFAFMGTSHGTKLLGTRRKFSQHGQSGAWVSELFPHTATIADDISLVKSCAANLFNHAPAKLFMNTGSGQFGRPSMGAWVTYGIGSESQNLPGFVVLQSGPRGPRGGHPTWGSGFLPTAFQGVPFRSGGEPILNLTSPKGITAQRQRQALNALRDLNAARLADTGDAEIATRISSYEMAYRMQSSAPELIDLSGESKRTLDMYGAQPGKMSFANNC